MLDYYTAIRLIIWIIYSCLLIKYFRKIDPSIDSMYIRQEILVFWFVIPMIVIIQRFQYFLVKIQEYETNPRTILYFHIFNIILLFIFIMYTTLWIPYKIKQDINKGYEESGTIELQSYEKKRSVRKALKLSAKLSSKNSNQPPSTSPSPQQYIQVKPGSSSFNFNDEYKSASEGTNSFYTTLTMSNITLRSSTMISKSNTITKFKEIGADKCDMWALINHRTGLIIFMTFLHKNNLMNDLMVCTFSKLNVNLTMCYIHCLIWLSLITSP